MKLQFDSEADWHAKRKQVCGGSDMAVLFGVSPWKTRGMLARQKLGLEEDSFIETKYIWWGKFMEEHILRAFDELTGIDVEPTHEMVIKGLIGTTLDAYAYPPPDLKPDTSRYVDWVGDVPTEPYLLEVKNLSKGSRERWKNDAVPDYYWWQCQAQMYTTGLQYCALLAKVDSARLEHHLVEADELAHEMMVERVEDFFLNIEEIAENE